jgi:hypothetical protein
MRSRRTRRFRDLYSRLPAEVRRQADEAYRLWKADMRHPSVRFKSLPELGRDVYSARVGAHYRAVGHFERNGDFVWDWIGSHADYDKLG